MYLFPEKISNKLFRHENRKTGFSECISKAEKFYNQLYELLRRRGKKSFAIKIRYGRFFLGLREAIGHWPCHVGKKNLFSPTASSDSHYARGVAGWA